jgi:hypothetical protein
MRWLTDQMFTLPSSLSPDTLCKTPLTKTSLEQSSESSDVSNDSKAQRAPKFRMALKLESSDDYPMPPLPRTCYINTHPHKHKAEASERVRVSVNSIILLICLYSVCNLCASNNIRIHQPRNILHLELS